nr:MAG TPA: hypothetical protein [Caudoviricetes sp.]
MPQVRPPTKRVSTPILNCKLSWLPVHRIQL